MIMATTLLSSFGFANVVSAAQYKVQPGDTLYSVSKKNNVPLSKLKEFNNLSSNSIAVGQWLKLDDQPVPTIQHTLKKGEYLTSIAKQYGISVRDILTTNPSIQEPSLVKVGQAILIPTTGTNKTEVIETPTAPPVQETPKTAEPALPVSTTKGITNHMIQKGDTLSIITKKYGVTLPILVAFNTQIKNINIVKLGDQLKIPNEEVIILAKIIHLEAQGEPMEGKIAVGNVILNRVRDDSFPNSIKEVVYQPNQFSPVKQGKMTTTIPNASSVEAAIRAYNGEVVTKDALFFFAPTTTSSYLKKKKIILSIGGHRFAK